jgi:hypothetical protein
VVFSAVNGAIVGVRQTGQRGSILRSGEHGLWDVRFQDGSEMSAASFAADSKEREFTHEADSAAKTLRLRYRSAALAVTVTATGREDGVEWTANVQPAAKTVLDFSLPARLRFDPALVERFVSPANGDFSVGTVFRRAFFQQQQEDQPSAWRGRSVGPQGYVSLYGGLKGTPEDQNIPEAANRPAANPR